MTIQEQHVSTSNGSQISTSIAAAVQELFNPYNGDPLNDFLCLNFVEALGYNAEEFQKQLNLVKESNTREGRA